MTAASETVRPIRVAFVSIFYPLFMGRYILEALLRRQDTEVWTAGPFTGRWIPWSGPSGNGMYLPSHYIFTPHMPLAFGTPPTINYAQIEAQAPWEPDIWIEVSSTLVSIGRPKHGIYTVVAADPHVLDYDPQRAKADAFFNMQKPYMKPGDRWLPYGYDPVWHAQTTIPWDEREYHATLLGLQYPQRTNLVNRLRGKLGLNVRYEIGPCYDDARAIYHSTKVGLNWSSLKDTTARCFELMAFGLPAVMNRVPDLLELFRDGQEFIGFDTEEEAVAGVKGLLAMPDAAQQIGLNARKAVEPHSWDARVDQILREAGLVRS